MNVQKQIDADLQKELWSTVKRLRDHFLTAELLRIDCDSLLDRMKAAGLADHLADIEEIRAAWNNES